MKAKRLKAFTLMEVLTVVVIIAILVGILIPALSQVKKLAKETKEKAEIGSIEVAVILYKNDFGEYPPSHGADATCPWPGTPGKDGYCYCGAQTLAEAMFGYDLLGFHPDSIYRANGWKKGGTTSADSLYPDPIDPVADKANLDARREAYLDRTSISVFTPAQIFDRKTCSDFYNFLEPDRYVICDVFTAVSRNIVLPSGSTKTYKIGTPVLYFRANPSPVNTEFIPKGDNNDDNVYDYTDGRFLMMQGRITDGKEHPLCPFTSKPSYSQDGTVFYDYIRDPMVPSPLRRAFRPDSFILISAGNDGLYGTHDDICNFEPNMPG